MDPEKFHFKLPQKHRPNFARAPLQKYPGIDDLILRRSSTRMYNPITGIRAVVIHATVLPDSPSSIQSMRRKESSFHFLVPGESEIAHSGFVWEVVPVELAAWHVLNSKNHEKVWNGKKKINHWSIGIEVVNTQTELDQFSSWQIDVTAKLVRWCWSKYPNLTHVVSHAMMDPSRRSDPGAQFQWPTFRKLVLESPPEPLPAQVLAAL